MTAAARGDAPTPQDAAAESLAEALVRTLREHEEWASGDRCSCQVPDEDGRTPYLSEVSFDAHLVARLLEAVAAAGPVPVAADVPTPSAATQNDEAQR